MLKFIKRKLKPHHYHFAHGWIWGVLVMAGLIIGGIGVQEGYFDYWFGSDYRIINVHEVIQGPNEASKLMGVMRKVNIQKTVLVGAPNQVLYFDGSKGFSGYEANNQTILDAQELRSSRIAAFCTLNPSEAGYMEVVADCVNKGAKGFKLYTGHSFFYDKALDDPLLFAFYEYVQKQKLPVIFHVNSSKYQEEFESVLKLYPDMKVICPHFCLSSSNLQRLSYLFDTYPNVYSDLSFGDEQFLKEGLNRISAEPQRYKEFIEKYGDRFFYGTDIIVTDYEGKDEEWLINLFQIYRDILEQETFKNELLGEIEWNGLNLNHDILTQIYEKNWLALVGE